MMPSIVINNRKHNKLKIKYVIAKIFSLAQGV
jgi:hypothetical protein